MTEKPIKKADLEARRQAEGADSAEGGQDRRDRRGGRGKKGDRRKGRDGGGKEQAAAVPLALMRGPKPSAKPKVTEVAAEDSDAMPEADTADADAEPSTAE